MSIAVVETHPIQYHAPIYRALTQELGIPVTAIYGSDFSVAGYHDREFETTFAWDVDLLDGYGSLFLSRVASGGARDVSQVTSRGVGRILEEMRPRVVLLVGYSPRFYREVLFEALRTSYPILFRSETTDHARERSPVKHVFRDLSLRVFYRRCAKLLYVGKRSLEHYRRLGCAKNKLVFSPYCVNASPFACDDAARDRLRMKARAEMEVDPDQFVLLFSGKLSRRKGPDLLVEAVNGLPGPIRDRVVLAFLGSGDMVIEIGEAARRADVSVRFLGFQNQTRLSQYYHAADLLVLPSRHSETWGLVVNEALHHGLPCVVSDAVGCAPDLIRPASTGETFESESVTSLSAALTRALSLTGKSQIRDRCREIVSAYTVERAAEGIAAAYWSVAGNRGRQSA